LSDPPLSLASLSNHRCVYCGAAASTRDHVPPKALFARPVRIRIRVPACSACNNGRSQSDEKFKVALAIMAGMKTPTQRRLWRDAMRTVRHSKGLHRFFADRIGDLPGTTSRAVSLPAVLIREQIIRLTKGLYWHHFRRALPICSPIDVFAPDSPGWEEVQNLFVDDAQKAHVGFDQFQYWFARVEEVPDASMWLFEFYRKVRFATTTGISESEED